MKIPKAEDVKQKISVLWDNLQCPICLELMITPVSTRCDHQFCKHCMMMLLEGSRRKEANCPVCKTKITKRSLQESAGFQRLIEGLRNMVQAYEHDTCTNYLTGISQPQRQTSVTECEDVSYDVHVTDLDGEIEPHNDPPVSLSSTSPAKDVFTKLMGLEDSCSFISDHERVDSGLDDAPITEKEADKASSSIADRQQQATDKEISQVVEKSSSRPRSTRERRTIQSEDPSCHLVLIPDEAEKQPVRRSSRNYKKETLRNFKGNLQTQNRDLNTSPDKIIDQRQKKSLEKVSEWLMKNSSTEENPEIEKNSRGALDLEDSTSVSGSCSSSLIKGNLDITAPKRDEGQGKDGKGLEEQVFGAVYKRERRGVRGFSFSNGEVIGLPAPSLAVETHTPKTIPKKRMSSKLTPADFVKKPRSEEKDDSVLEDQTTAGRHENDPEDIILKEPEEHQFIELTDDLGSNSTDRHGQDLEELPEEGSNERKGGEDSPVFDVSLQQPGRRPRGKMLAAWQDVDGDLQEQAKATLVKGEKKKVVKKKSETGKADTGKSAKVPNPLVLTGVREKECNSIVMPKNKLASVESEAQIENFPSSEDTGSPNRRKTRSRSRRLQLFTEEVQGVPKKTRTRKPATNVPVPGSDVNKVQPFEEAAANTEHTVCSQNHKEMIFVRRNGCVYEEDMGGIEIMESSEKNHTKITAGQESFPVEECVTKALGTGSLCEEHVASSSVAMVPSSNPPEANGPCPVLGTISKTQTVKSPPIDMEMHVQLKPSESVISVMEKEEEEEDRNDSELDTEQLLKSFKATKRKSFHLGSPTLKRSSPRLDKENVDDAQTLQNNVVDAVLEEDKDQELSDTRERPVVQQEPKRIPEPEHSCSSELIPPSKSPNRAPQNVSLKSRRGLRRPGATRPALKTLESSVREANVKTQESVLSRLSGNSASSVLSPNKVAKTFGVSEEDSPVLTPLASEHSGDNDNQGPSHLHGRVRKSLSEEEGSHSLRPEAAVETDKACSDVMSRTVANSESSLTPDGLQLPVIQTSASQGVESGTGSGDVGIPSPMESSLRQRKKRKAQRLESSASDCSSEEDVLPPLAQIFLLPACPPAVEKAAAGSPKDKVQEQQSHGEAGRGGSNRAPVTEGPPACDSPDWVSSSQASVDLFGTPEECDVAVTDTGLSVESSQFSSEVIGTQQRLAMQEELSRLKRMMALVTEALQEKESGDVPAASPYPCPLDQPGISSAASPWPCPLDQPGVSSAASPCPCPPDQTSVPAGQDLRVSAPDVQGNGGNCAREVAPEGGEDAASLPCGSGASEGLGPTPPCLTMSLGTGQRCRQSGQSLRSNGANKMPTPVESERKPGSKLLPMKAASVLSEGQKAKESQRAAPPTKATPQRDSTGVNLVLVVSGLGLNEQSMVKKFAKRVGGSVCSQVTAETTHIIMRTDGQLVCERTLKYFLGIAGRKWVVSYQWISECFKQGKVLDEASFEVRGDLANGPSHQGPMRARTTGDRSLLMKDFEICFQGPFTDMTVGEYQPPLVPLVPHWVSISPPWSPPG